MLKVIAERQDSPQWKTYDKIKSFIRLRTSQDRKTATNRLIASLQPNLLATIVQDKYLKNAFTLMKWAGFADIPEYNDKTSWFENSYHLLSYFKAKLKCHSAYDICTYPWQVYEYLKNLYKKQIRNMQNIESYINLLKANKNLVLTGAPGTGKTFMARAIAEEMGCTEEEMCFVQFHPSYDYTDFVEGLRPVDKGNGQIGFERKDGVFKDFCKKALKNLIDSKKSGDEREKELSWEELLQQFITNAIDDDKQFKLKKGKMTFSIDDVRDRNIIIRNENNEKTAQVSVNADEIIQLLVNDVKLNNVSDIRRYFRRKYGRQADSYSFILAKEVKKRKKDAETPFFLKSNNHDVQANTVKRKPYVFIIDEINRGEASKIFGELFFAIDPGYRGKADLCVKTQYQNLVSETDVFTKGFYVPENVYILATMNDIDRSVESMDFAMRRRFTWKEVTPSDTQSMLDALSCADKAKSTMHRLNEVISNTEGLGSAYMVGPSYFLKLNHNGADFKLLWDMNIEPLLKEYVRGFRNATDILDNCKKAYFSSNNISSSNDDSVDRE